VQKNLPFASAIFFVQDEGIHNSNVNEVVEESIVLLLRFVQDLVVTYQAI